mmetsp:Transcript_20318/g.51506  ORF Transcript_20318/g.51506 Transcript_20318/m.51506 type:complete len:244 (+) Transcript_20318:278-1009(+)
MKELISVEVGGVEADGQEDACDRGARRHTERALRVGRIAVHPVDLEELWSDLLLAALAVGRLARETHIQAVGAHALSEAAHSVRKDAKGGGARSLQPQLVRARAEEQLTVIRLAKVAVHQLTVQDADGGHLTTCGSSSLGDRFTSKLEQWRLHIVGEYGSALCHATRRHVKVFEYLTVGLSSDGQLRKMGAETQSDHTLERFRSSEEDQFTTAANHLAEVVLRCARRVEEGQRDQAALHIEHL